jgi:catechol 2,3-dioxygenase-like lactoylglutathione lyase family enzyme
MLTSALVNPILPAADVARARAFYVEGLGLEPAAEGQNWVLIRTDGYWFAITGSPAAGTNQATALEFLVSDLDAEMAEIRRRGIAFEEYEFEDWATIDGVAESAEGRSAWFKDSEGNIISLTELAPEMVAGMRQMVGFDMG